MIEALILYGLWLGALSIVGVITERYPRLIDRIGKWVLR